MTRPASGLAALLALSAFLALGQDKTAQEKVAEFSKKLKASEKSGTSDSGAGGASTPNGAQQPDDVMESIWCADVSDQQTRDVCWKAYQARMNYYIHAMDHRAEDFWWQHVASRLIFAMVIGLVAIGVYFAWVQFRKDINRPPGTEEANSEKSPPKKTSKDQHESPPPETDLELSLGGLKIKSPVLGVIILALSLGFFYLYLRYVFPMSDTF